MKGIYIVNAFGQLDELFDRLAELNFHWERQTAYPSLHRVRVHARGASYTSALRGLKDYGTIYFHVPRDRTIVEWVPTVLAGSRTYAPATWRELLADEAKMATGGGITVTATTNNYTMCVPKPDLKLGEMNIMQLASFFFPNPNLLLT